MKYIYKLIFKIRFLQSHRKFFHDCFVSNKPFTTANHLDCLQIERLPKVIEVSFDVFPELNVVIIVFVFFWFAFLLITGNSGKLCLLFWNKTVYN